MIAAGRDEPFLNINEERDRAPETPPVISIEVLNSRDHTTEPARAGAQEPASLRVLVLSYETPAYPAAGGPSRQHVLLEPLAKRHRIRVLSTGGDPPFGRPPAGVEIRRIDPGPPVTPERGSWLSRNARHYLVGGPWLYVLALHHERALAAVLDEELQSLRPDVVIVEHEELAPLLKRIPSEIPAALVLHNMLLEVQWQNRRRGSVWESIKAMLELFVLAREERRALGAAAATVVVSEPSMRLGRSLRRSAKLSLIPNCVNVEYFRRHGARADHPVIVMTASYHYPPNQAAARELIEEIFPVVRSQVPGVELRLVGQQMPSWMEKLAGSAPGVSLVGAVDDIRPELEGAWVAVAPLRQGSGSPLKVLEALSMEVPVVATTRVGRALGLGPEDGVLTARRPDELARAIASILNDQARCARLGAAGRATVERRFDAGVVALDLERVWRAAARKAGDR